MIRKMWKVIISMKQGVKHYRDLLVKIKLQNRTLIDWQNNGINTAICLIINHKVHWEKFLKLKTGKQWITWRDMEHSSTGGLEGENETIISNVTEGDFPNLKHFSNVRFQTEQIYFIINRRNEK